MRVVRTKEQNRQAARRRAERLARGEVEVQHGEPSTYSNYQCRCEPCREAWSDYQAARRPMWPSANRAVGQ